MKKSHQKHKTIGVSFHPLLRQRAGVRAREVGVSFSRYVSLCVEAEIAGESKLPAHPRRRASAEAMAAALAGWDAAAAKERLGQDIGCVLERNGIGFIPQARVGGITTDFLIELCLCRNCRKAAAGALAFAAKGMLGTTTGGSGERTGGDAWSGRGSVTGADTLGRAAVAANAADITFVAGAAGSGGKSGAGTGGGGRSLICRNGGGKLNGTSGRNGEGGRNGEREALRVALECWHPVAAEHAVMLGRAVMLQQVATVDAVLLCVPYLNLLEPELQAVFARQKIGVVTPDGLPEALYAGLAAAGRRARAK